MQATIELEEPVAFLRFYRKDVVRIGKRFLAFICGSFLAWWITSGPSGHPRRHGSLSYLKTKFFLTPI